MNTALILIGVSGVIEIALGLRPIFKWRRQIAIPLFIVVSVSSAWLEFRSAQFLYIDVVVFLSLYRLFNLYRIIYSKIQLEHLRRVSRTTAYRIVLLQAMVIVLGIAANHFNLSFQVGVVAMAVIASLISALLLSSVISTKHISKKINSNTRIADNQLPTLTVAIPARNETETLNQCLISLLASNYPKLEIIVLDDHSTNRKTSEIIRSFAHDGVIFIPGTNFNNEWLAKNWAYQKLLDAANGDLIMFCGADTRFAADSLSFLVSALISRNKDMISVMPKNALPKSFTHMILQPLRYAWEVAMPRRIFNRPPVLATCWLTNRSFLIKSGGFKAVSRRISPESYFATRALKDDGYSFFQFPDLISDKNKNEQFETALRLRYPQVKRQPEWVALLSLVELVGSLSLVPLLLFALFTREWQLLGVSLIGNIFYFASFGLVVNETYNIKQVFGYLLWPLAVLVDAFILNLSMCKYEFGTVLWKGRSITSPVMNLSLGSDSDQDSGNRP